MNTRNAYVLFGGVGSGKTTIAERLEREPDTSLVSYDRLIFEFALRTALRQPDSAGDSLHRAIQASFHANLILDGIARQPIIDRIHETKRRITAIFLDISRECRKERFDRRLETRRLLLEQISGFMQINLASLNAHEIRSLRFGPGFFDAIPDPMTQQMVTHLMRELYLLGANYFVDEHPNPADFRHIDYVATCDEKTDLSQIDLDMINSQRVSFDEYKSRIY